MVATTADKMRVTADKHRSHPHGCSIGTPASGCRPGARCRNHRGRCGQPQPVGEVIAALLRRWAA